jgi:MFS family permease
MKNKPLILLSLLLAALLINLETTMVNVALPTLVRELHATESQLQWVVDIYNLVFAALLLTAGSLSDRFGRKGMLLAGLAVFGASSIAGGLTSDVSALIAARAFMGLGAAMTFPPTLSLISNVFTGRRERAQAIGLWGATIGVAVATGPIVGGWLLAHFAWSSVFYAMGPVAAVTFLFVALSVPTSKHPVDGRIDLGAGPLEGHRGLNLRGIRGRGLTLASISSRQSEPRDYERPQHRLRVAGSATEWPLAEVGLG